MRIHHGFEADGKKGNEKREKTNDMSLSFNHFTSFPLFHIMYMLYSSTSNLPISGTLGVPYGYHSIIFGLNLFIYAFTKFSETISINYSLCCNIYSSIHCFCYHILLKRNLDFNTQYLFWLSFFKFRPSDILCIEIAFCTFPILIKRNFTVCI